MTDHRRESRFQPAHAKVAVEGVPCDTAFLKDISITGCCIECRTIPEFIQGNQYKIKIFPEKQSKIGEFDILGELKWVYKGDSFGEVGFFILESPKGKAFENFVDYLSWCSTVSG